MYKRNVWCILNILRFSNDIKYVYNDVDYRMTKFKVF